MSKTIDQSGQAVSKIIGRNIRHLRHAAGLSLKDLADFLGISHQQVQKYETGQDRLPVDKLIRLQFLYQVPYETLFSGIQKNILEERPEEWALFVKLSRLEDRALKSKITKSLASLLG